MLLYEWLGVLECCIGYFFIWPMLKQVFSCPSYTHSEVSKALAFPRRVLSAGYTFAKLQILSDASKCAVTLRILNELKGSS
jgi:hypothetical protein